MRRAQLPLTISEVRTADEGDYTLARGALIAAELEQRIPTRKAA
jgi:hypothetical protein